MTTTEHDPFETTNLPSPDQHYVLARDQGDHRHFLNHLATTKVAPGTTGSLTAIEFFAPRGFGPPLHVHDAEDEVMIVLEGEIRFGTDQDSPIGTAGSTVFLPHGIPHTFQVLSESARFSTITASNSGIPEFDQMVEELGVPTDEPVLPVPSDIDPGQVAAVCAEHGITVLGPPPAPLD